MNRKAGLSLVITLVVLASVISSSVAQSVNPPLSSIPLLKQTNPGDKLSFRLEALNSSAALRLLSTEEQARLLSLPAQGAGSLMRNLSGELLVEIRVRDTSDAVLQELHQAGAQIVNIAAPYKTVTAFVDTSSLTPLADIPEVESIQEELTPMTSGLQVQTQSISRSQAPSLLCPHGNIATEGDTQLHAVDARTTYTLTGSGVKVGILSDSFDQAASVPTHASDDILTADLPGASNPCGDLTPVNVISPSLASGNTDEGRAMLQIVHDLAPGAGLSFASAFNGLFQFADNIRHLRTAGADIIADDVFYFKEPFFQEGPVNVAISDVVNSGALYFALAGNNNQLVGGKNIGSYEAPAYRPTTCPVAINYTITGTCHDFDPGAGVNATEGITLTSGGALVIDFQWAEPWYGVTDNLDIYLLDNTNSVIAGSNYVNTTTQTPFEFFGYQNITGSTQRYKLVINRYSGTGTPRLKYLMIQSTFGLQGVQYNTSSGGDIIGPTLFGHSASRSAFSVAAVPYSDSNTPEYYTSRGPGVHYFGPVVGSTPAAAIPPETIAQPDFAATDGGCNTFFGGFSGGCYRFYGTSAATPHAAAIAALLKQRASQLHILLTRGVTDVVLKSTAQTVSGGTPDSVGAGLLNALAAVAKLPNIKLLYLPEVIH